MDFSSFFIKSLVANILFFIAFGGGQLLYTQNNSSPLEQSLADVYVNNVSGGNLLFFLDENKSPLIPVESLNLALKNKVKPEILNALIKEKTYITVSDLEPYGISLLYSSSTLSLSFTLTPQVMISQDLSDPIKLASPKRGYFIEPEVFSALIGTSLILTPTYNFGRINYPSWQAELNLNPAFRIFGFVVEGSLAINFYNSNTTNLKNLLISYDFPTIGARAYMGTINPPVSAFQIHVNLIGLGFTNGIGPRGELYSGQSLVNEILLPHPSDLLVEINGVNLKTFHLPAGSYKFTDLPLDTGLNNLKLHIHEVGGSERILEMAVSSDGKILPPGETEYAINFGLDRVNLNKLHLTNKFSLGLSPFFEIRENSSTDFDKLFGGVSLLWASPLGSIGITEAISLPFSGNTYPGHASRVDWQLAFPSSPYIPKIGLSLGYRSKYFNTSPDSTRIDVDNFNISSQITQVLPIKLGTIAAYSGARFFGNILESLSLSLGIFIPVFGLGSLSLFGGTDWHHIRGYEPRLSLSFSLVQENRNNLLYQQNLLVQNETLELRFPLDPKDSMNLTFRESGILTQNKESRELSLSGNYLGDNVSLSASSNLTQTLEMEQNQVWLELRAASTMAFAGGHFGFLNGLPEAFVFLVPKKSIGLLPLVLHPPQGQEVISTEGRPALASGFRSYVPVNARIEMPDSPPEVRPYPGNIQLTPSYRSGTVVEISSAPIQSFKGRLLNQEGSIISGQIGKVFLIGDSANPVASTFTDEKGLFECYGVDFGDYQIFWSGNGVSNFSLSGEGMKIIDLGDLKMIHQGNGDK